MSLLINCECGRVVKAETEDRDRDQSRATTSAEECIPSSSESCHADDIVAMSEEVDD